MVVIQLAGQRMGLDVNFDLEPLPYLSSYPVVVLWLQMTIVQDFNKYISLNARPITVNHHVEAVDTFIQIDPVYC